MAPPATTPCAQCRLPLPTGARFCNHCGAVQPTPAPPPTSASPSPSPSSPRQQPQRRFGAQTILGVESPNISPQGQPAGKVALGGGPRTPSERPAKPPQQAFAQTMLATDATTPQPTPAVGAVAAAAVAAKLPLSVKQTMVGVAAPVETAARPQATPAPARLISSPPPADAPAISNAPTPPPAWLPQAAPMGAAQSEPSAQPRKRTRSRTPADAPTSSGGNRGAWIAGGLFATAVVAAGVTSIFLVKSTTPPELTAELKSNELLLHCDDCSDGSEVALGASRRATFAKGAASVVLEDGEVHAGSNSFTATIRPKQGATRSVSFSVEVPFLVHTSLTPLARGERKIEIDLDVSDRVKKIEVDGEVVKAKDGHAIAEVSIPAPPSNAPTATTTEDAKPAAGGDRFDKVIEYEISLGGGEHKKGSVRATVAYAPLRLGLPGVRAIVVGDDVQVTGHTSPGATVRFGKGAEASTTTADGLGSFRATVKVAAGVETLEVRAYGPKLAARSEKIALVRATSIAEGMKALKALPSATLASVLDRPREHIGEMLSVHVDVQSVAEEDGRAVAICDLRCPAKTECPLLKLRLPAGVLAHRGDSFDVVGVVLAPIKADTGAVSALVMDGSGVVSTSHE